LGFLGIIIPSFKGGLSFKEGWDFFPLGSQGLKDPRAKGSLLNF